MEEYKKHIQDLREHEHKPFKPSPDTYKVFISSFIYCNIVIICNNLMWCEYLYDITWSGAVYA
jgi:hypothetical protein